MIDAKKKEEQRLIKVKAAREKSRQITLLLLEETFVKLCELSIYVGKVLW